VEPHLLAIVTYNADAQERHAMKPGIAARTLNEAVRALVAERDENTCRKDFAPSEAVALARDLEPFERQDARETAARTRPYRSWQEEHFRQIAGSEW